MLVMARCVLGVCSVDRLQRRVKGGVDGLDLLQNLFSLCSPLAVELGGACIACTKGEEVVLVDECSHDFRWSVCGGSGCLWLCRNHWRERHQPRGVKLVEAVGVGRLRPWELRARV